MLPSLLYVMGYLVLIQIGCGFKEKVKTGG